MDLSSLIKTGGDEISFGFRSKDSSLVLKRVKFSHESAGNRRIPYSVSVVAALDASPRRFPASEDRSAIDSRHYLTTVTEIDMLVDRWCRLNWNADTAQCSTTTTTTTAGKI